MTFSERVYSFFRAAAGAGALDPEDFAYTPDLADAGTWRLPLKGDDGEYDERRVRAALGCLSHDAYPSIPAKAHRQVRARVAAAWRSLHGDDAELPAMLRKADMFDPEPLDADGTPHGIMLALLPTDEVARAIAIPGGEKATELHVTLCYLGPHGTFTPQDVAELPAVVAGWVHAQRMGPVHCEVTGWAVFEAREAGADEPAVALIDSPGIQQWRESLSVWLAEHGYPAYSDFSWLPHMTLGWGKWLQSGSLPKRTPGMFFDCDAIAVSHAGVVTRVPLDGDVAERRALDEAGYPVEAPIMLRKDDAKRYTLAPLYLPDAYDSHNEKVTAADLEEAVWEYMRGGDFNINFQHIGGTRAGECVGVICWPFDEHVQMTTGKGEVRTVTLPAGAIYQGVVWEEWAWPLVLEGKINALSMEGVAVKVPVDKHLPGAHDQASHGRGGGFDADAVAAKINSGAAQAAAEGSVVVPMAAEEARMQMDDLAEMMGPEWTADEGVRFTNHAIGEPGGELFVGVADGLGVTGAVNVQVMRDPEATGGAPPTLHMEYMGSTGFVTGAGSQMTAAVVKRAAREGLAIHGEPASEGAATFWRKMGMTPDPYGVGQTGVGMTAEQVQAVAGRLT